MRGSVAGGLPGTNTAMNSLHRYQIKPELSLPGEASERYSNLRFGEDCRKIGGDLGDLLFEGFDVVNGNTVLRSPVLVSSLQLGEEEATELASEILLASFDSIGLETLYR